MPSKAVHRIPLITKRVPFCRLSLGGKRFSASGGCRGFLPGRAAETGLFPAFRNSTIASSGFPDAASATVAQDSGFDAEMHDPFLKGMILRKGFQQT
jgi:hypothetical protein